MAIDLRKDRGTPVPRQRFTWRELVQPTYSKLNDDAFTRVRVILMNGIEIEALLDRVYGQDANNILQSYTDILPGRPTLVEHRAPIDDLRRPYSRSEAEPLSKLNALTLVAGEFQTHDYYMNIGPTFSDPVARQLYAEIASIEEQHVTQYEPLADPSETWLEKWVLHEANEVYNYWCCAEQESNPRLRAI